MLLFFAFFHIVSKKIFLFFSFERNENMSTIRRTTRGTSQIQDLETRMGDVDNLSGPPTNDSHETSELNLPISQAEVIARCNPAIPKTTAEDAFKAISAKDYTSTTATAKSDKADIYQVSGTGKVFVANSFPIKDANGSVISNKIEIDCSKITHLCFNDVAQIDDAMEIELLNCENLQWVFLPGNTKQNCVFLKNEGKIQNLLIMGEMKEFACAWDTKIKKDVNENYNFVFEKCGETTNANGGIELLDVEYRNAYIGTQIGFDGSTIYADIVIVDQSGSSSASTTSDADAIADAPVKKTRAKKATETTSSSLRSRYVADDDDDYYDDEPSYHSYHRRNPAIVDAIDTIVFHAQSVYLDSFPSLELLVITGRTKNVETKNCAKLFAIMNQYHFSRLNADKKTSTKQKIDTLKIEYKAQIEKKATTFDAINSTTTSSMRLRNNPQPSAYEGQQDKFQSRYKGPDYVNAKEASSGYQAGARASRASSKINKLTSQKISDQMDVEGVFVQTCPEFQMLLVNSNFVCFSNMVDSKNIILDIAERICLDDCKFSVLVLNQCKTLYILDADLNKISQGCPIKELDFPSAVSETDGFAIWVADEKHLVLPVMTGAGMVDASGQVVPRIVEIQPAIGDTQIDFEQILIGMYDRGRLDPIVKKGLSDWSFRQTFPIKTAIGINALASKPLVDANIHGTDAASIKTNALAFRKKVWINLLYKLSCMNGEKEVEDVSKLVELHDDASNDFNKRPFDFVLKFPQITKDAKDVDQIRLRSLYSSTWEKSLEIWRYAIQTSFSLKEIEPLSWGEVYLRKAFAPVQLRAMVEAIATIASSSQVLFQSKGISNILDVDRTSEEFEALAANMKAIVTFAQELQIAIRESLHCFVYDIALNKPILQEYSIDKKVLTISKLAPREINGTNQLADKNKNQSLNVMYKYANAFNVDSSNFAHDFNIECLIEMLDIFMNGIAVSTSNKKNDPISLLSMYSVEELALFIELFGKYTSMYPYSEKVYNLIATCTKYRLPVNSDFDKDHELQQRIGPTYFSDQRGVLAAALGETNVRFDRNIEAKLEKAIQAKARYPRRR